MPHLATFILLLQRICNSERRSTSTQYLAGFEPTTYIGREPSALTTKKYFCSKYILTYIIQVYLFKQSFIFFTQRDYYLLMMRLEKEIETKQVHFKIEQTMLLRILFAFSEEFEVGRIFSLMKVLFQ